MIWQRGWMIRKWRIEPLASLSCVLSVVFRWKIRIDRVREKISIGMDPLEALSLCPDKFLTRTRSRRNLSSKTNTKHTALLSLANRRHTKLKSLTTGTLVQLYLIYFVVASPAKPALGAYPPYPPYAPKAAPPSVAETIIAGRDLRVQHKSQPRQPVRPLPRPAKPK